MRGHLRSRVGRALVLTGLLGGLTLSPLLPAVPGTAHADAGTPTPTATSTVTATPTATVTPGPTNTPTPTSTPSATATPTQQPTPKPLKLKSAIVHRTNGYQIGAYYFSGWSHGQNNNLTTLLMQGPLRKYEPLDGWYDDSQKQVDKNIVRAAKAGIDFFAFDWYDLARSRFPTDKSLNQALGFYLGSKQRTKLNFSITFIDQAPFLPRAKDWPGLVKQWIPLFAQPDYVKVNGKPLFIIFSPEHMRDIFGNSKNVHKALDYLRGAVHKAAAKNPSLRKGITIATGATIAVHYNPATVGMLRSEGYDVMTGYNYHALGGEKYRKPAPYTNLVKENVDEWIRVAKVLPQPYIPVITSGWDQRFSAREQKTAIIYSGRTPAKFSCFAADARHWIDTNAKHTVKEKIVMVFAWNEIGEGGFIVPTRADRTSYVDALHQVFTAHKAPVCKAAKPTKSGKSK